MTASLSISSRSVLRLVATWMNTGRVVALPRTSYWSVVPPWKCPFDLNSISGYSSAASISSSANDATLFLCLDFGHLSLQVMLRDSTTNRTVDLSGSCCSYSISPKNFSKNRMCRFPARTPFLKDFQRRFHSRRGFHTWSIKYTNRTDDWKHSGRIAMDVSCNESAEDGTTIWARRRAGTV